MLIIFCSDEKQNCYRAKYIPTPGFKSFDNVTQITNQFDGKNPDLEDWPRHFSIFECLMGDSNQQKLPSEKSPKNVYFSCI